MPIREIAHNVYVVPYGKKGAATVVTFGGDASTTVDASLDRGRATGTKADHIPRGDDKVLHRLHQLACESPNKWQLIYTKADFAAGLGLGVGIEKVVGDDIKITPVIDPAYTEWIDRLALNDYIPAAALQLAFAEEFYVRFAFETGGKLLAVDVVDVFDIRPAKLEKGQTKVTAYLINANYGTSRFKKDEYVRVPAFDSAEPAKYPVSILRVARPAIPGQRFFALSPWWGTENWTKVSNKVPVFNDKGLDNGYFITHHISIPDDYFDQEGFEDDEKRKAHQKQVLDAMAETVSSYENPNKVLFTFHKTDSLGKELPGVRITPLKSTIDDEAFLNLYNAANIAQAQGHGVLPALAGIETGAKLGGSGKELEASANYMQDFLTVQHRRLILKPLLLAQKIDGLDPAKTLYIRQIKTYTYDVTAKNHLDNPRNEEGDPSEDEPKNKPKPAQKPNAD
ncbi:hypothetical protein [Larkinella terrae]|uniref:Phage portal protein n=1 Tax=Larkinella terrae TaxID=2025311 RepID=A0A7K0EKA1_9BACT|nr:hypothetical protein [Larkinella terrae]MRS61888.1 hypothetical protein [Larkinella terrae]